jgi:very-short-patch-repair endonuclease
MIGHPLDIACPACGAEAGQNCIRKWGGVRLSFHRARGSRRRAPFEAKVDRVATDSPIEAVLASFIIGWLDHNEITGAIVRTQAKLGRGYRADILIEIRGRKLVIECDGEAFHTTKEQIAHDKKRDRYCATNGMAVMRFTGSEINRDPRGCAAEVGIWIRLP